MNLLFDLVIRRFDFIVSPLVSNQLQLHFYFVELFGKLHVGGQSFFVAATHFHFSRFD